MCEESRFLFYNLLTEDEKKSLRINNYSKNETVSEFIKIDKFYFILEGELKLFRYLENATVKLSSVLSNGYIVGIIRFLNNKKNVEIAIVVSENLKVIEIPYEIIVRLKKESLEFNSYLMDLILKRGMEEWETLYIRTFFGLKGLIAHYLIKHSHNNYVYIDNFNKIIENLNISSNGFYRVINQLIDEKIIEKSENSIKIIENEKIKKLYSI